MRLMIGGVGGALSGQDNRRVPQHRVHPTRLTESFRSSSHRIRFDSLVEAPYLSPVSTCACRTEGRDDLAPEFEPLRTVSHALVNLGLPQHG